MEWPFSASVSFRGRRTLQVPVVCVYKLNKTSTTASIAERAFPWKHKALSLVHEEPRSKRKCKVRERGCVATVRVIIDESPLQNQNSRTLAFAVAFGLCSYSLTFY